MLVTPAGNPLLIAGQKILTPGRFVDNFQRGAGFNSRPVGMGWTDMGILQPQNFDKSHIYNGMVGSADPYWRGKNGATMAPDDQWQNYADYPGQAVGGLGAMIRNVGDGIYNYDVTARVGGVLSGATELGPESEGTPLVGVNVDSDGLGYGAWLVNFRADFGFDVFIFIIGTMGNPPETFNVTHRTGVVTHTQGQERDVTLKYRGTGFTLWLDGVQRTDILTHPDGVPTSSFITVPAEYQNKSWAGFEYDQHITDPSMTTTTPSIISYSHQATT